MLLSMASVKATKSYGSGGSKQKGPADEVRVQRAKGGFLVHESRPYVPGESDMDHKPTVHTSIHKAFRHAKQCMGGAGMAEEAGEQE